MLIHLSQGWRNEIGGKMFVQSGFLDTWAGRGWLTVAYSQPGYGDSDGPAEFCGPAFQQAALEIIGHFRTMDIVKKCSIFVYGGSLGAVIAAMVATKDSRIAGFVLRSGRYDFVDA